MTTSLPSRLGPPLLALALLGLLLPFVPSAVAGESISARLLKIEATYGQETWKYDTAYEGVFGPTQTLAHIQNRTASFYGALGLKASLQIQIYDTQNPNADLRNSAYNLTAYLPTSKGNLYAYVKRAPGSAPGPSDSPIFWLDFDMDGTNNGDPLGRYPPAAEPGLKSVHVDITKRQQDNPPSRPVGTSDFVFTYEIPSTTATVERFGGLNYLQAVPDGIFRLYNDIGWGDSVLLVDRAVEPTTPVNLAYQFTTPNQNVRLLGFLAERGVNAGGATQPVSNPSLPFIPGISDNRTLQNALGATDTLIAIHQKELAQATTGPDGRVTFTLTGDDLLRIRPTAAPGALVVVAPLVDPGMPSTPDARYAGGSAELRVGATEIVLPVTDRRASIERYRLLESSGGAMNLPDPVRGYGMAVNGLQVDVRDIDGFTNPPQLRSGDLYAIVPDVRNSATLSGAGLSPTQSDTNLLRGTLGVRGIQEQGVSHYRLLAFLYRESDIFYTLTYGDRGYWIDVAATSVPAGTPSTVWVNLTSRNTNFDLLANEPDFALRVFVKLVVADLKYNQTTPYALNEGAALALSFPFVGNRTGDVRVDVGSTAGDVTPRDLRVNMNFFEPKAKKTLADRIPGVEAGFVLVALATVAMLVSLRRP